MLKKLLASTIIIFALMLVPVLAADLVVSNEVNTAATVNPGATLQGSFKITNTGASAISNIAIDVLNPLTGPGGTISASQISFQPNIVVSLPSAGSQTVQFTLNVPQGQAPGLYVGTVEATDGGSNTAPVSLEITVPSKPGINVVASSISVSAQADDTRTTTFQIINTGNAPLSLDSSSFSHNINLTDDDGDVINVEFDPQFTSLAAGQTGNVRLNVDVENNVDINTYDGTVTVSSGSVSDTFNLAINVQPEVCKDGPVGDLRINIRDPDDNDDFAPGDTINFDVDVENDDDDDHDITVTAILYNLDTDDNIEEVDSDEINIDDGDEENFEFDLEIPTGDEVNEDDEYVIYIKAYEDGNEDEQCEQDELSIDIQRERNDVRVDDASVSPSIVSCGESTEFSVDVVNVGSRNQDDVYVQLKESSLGINQRSEEFELDDGDSNDNDATKRFTVRVPSDAKAGSYLVEASVYYDSADESASEFVTLEVVCDGGQPSDNDDEDNTPTPSVPVSIEVIDSQITSSGSSFSIPVKVTNNGNAQKTFMVSLDNVADWASPVSEKTLTLNAGQASTLYFYVTADEDASGRQSASVNVKSSGAVVASETISVDLGSAEESGNFFGSVGSFVKDNSTIFWIIGNLVLIVLIVLFLKVLFTKRKN